MKFFNRNSAILTLALTAMGTTAAHATTIGIAPTSGNSYQLTSNNLTNWSNASGGYNFVFSTAGTAVSGTNAGLIMDGATSGSDFLALDADYQVGAVTTNLGTLSAGDVVTVTFGFAGSQQLYGSDGCSNNGPAPHVCEGDFDAELAVTLGGLAPTANATLDAASVSTLGSPDIITNAGICHASNAGTGEKTAPCILSQTWSGFTTETLTYDVTSTNSGVLSFLASDPNAAAQDPAFALLDNVTYSVTTPSATPEPSSLMLLSTGLMGLGGFVRSRIKKS
jgi:hypothetical protein